jgi:hypothetical protein
LLAVESARAASGLKAGRRRPTDTVQITNDGKMLVVGLR